MHGRHPYFTSPLAWHDRLDEALAEARTGAKRVFTGIANIRPPGSSYLSFPNARGHACPRCVPRVRF